jgi:hypothetical protein
LRTSSSWYARAFEDVFPGELSRVHLALEDSHFLGRVCPVGLGLERGDVLRAGDRRLLR